MKGIERVYRDICLALVAFSLIFHGSAVAAPARANAENVVSAPELYKAMATRAHEEAAARGAVLKVLKRSEVRRVAARAGLDLKRAQAAVSVLSGEELREVADQARRVDRVLAGGANHTIVISTAGLVIAALVVLILVAA